MDFVVSDDPDMSTACGILGYPCYVDSDSKMAVLDIYGVNIATVQANCISLERCISVFLQQFDPDVSLAPHAIEILEISRNCSSLVMLLDIMVFLCLSCALGDKVGRDDLIIALRQRLPGLENALFRLGGLPPIDLFNIPPQTVSCLEESKISLTPGVTSEGNLTTF